MQNGWTDRRTAMAIPVYPLHFIVGVVMITFVFETVTKHCRYKSCQLRQILHYLYNDTI